MIAYQLDNGQANLTSGKLTRFAALHSYGYSMPKVYGVVTSCQPDSKSAKTLTDLKTNNERILLGEYLQISWKKKNTLVFKVIP